MKLIARKIKQAIKRVVCERRQKKQEEIKEGIKEILDRDNIPEMRKTSEVHETSQVTTILGRIVQEENRQIKKLLNLLKQEEILDFLRTLSPKEVRRIRKIYEEEKEKQTPKERR